MKFMISGLKEYNLTPEDFFQRDYICEAAIYCVSQLQDKFLKDFSPNDRKSKNNIFLTKNYKFLASMVSTRNLKPIGPKRAPVGIEGTFNSRELTALSKRKIIRDVYIRNIKGVKKVPLKKTHQEKWFNVVCRYVIQIEKQRQGMQTHEIRHVLVKAKDSEQAERKVQAESKKYGKPYFNTDMEQVKWQLIEVIDICSILDDYNVIDQFGDEFIETYTKFESKRFNKKYYWEG